MKRIGLDIGGTSVKGAVLEEGNIIFETKVPTRAADGRDAILESILNLLDLLTPYAGGDAPVGVGSAGDIDPVEGRVVYATDSLPNFTGLPLRQLLEEKTGRTVTVINDAVAALIGEMKYGAAQGKENVILLTLGTGLGGGIAVSGRFLLGTNFRGGRIGHIPLYREGRLCKCGKSGCAEQYVSATALVQNGIDKGLAVTDSNQIFQLAAEGDKRAQTALDKFLKDLAAVIEILVNLFDPQVVLLGGGLTEARGQWWDLLLPLLTTDIVKPAVLGNKAGFYGSQYATFDQSLFEYTGRPCAFRKEVNPNANESRKI